jgi:hypothetical protein
MDQASELQAITFLSYVETVVGGSKSGNLKGQCQCCWIAKAKETNSELRTETNCTLKKTASLVFLLNLF